MMQYFLHRRSGYRRVGKVTKLILDIYKAFGFNDVILKYADRPKIRVGDDNVWDKSEKALLEAIKASGIKYEINKGEDILRT